ncbi:MAG TPA: SulP family inorganic anion transporter [Rhodocyclaceae bacterium]|nr:SulP family inorganic anion transporter [Rhodocyclaceae bacterium]HNC80125.1 SulP family inorganic anion transporter [Rhodocyclaceae bacterium]
MTTPAPPDSDRFSDLLAGVSLAGLLLPEAVAYSSIANLPPQAGVMALFAGLLAYGALGTSRFAVVSATSSSAAVLAAVTASLAGGDAVLRGALAGGMILLAGVFFVLAGLARMGNASDFISKPVLRGFAFGLALTIALKQLPKMVDVHPAQGDLLHFVPALFGHVADWNLAGLGLGGASLALLFVLERLRPVPGALVVTALGIVLARTVDLAAWGVDTVGPIRLHLAAPDLPDLSRAAWLRLAEVAVAMVLVLYAESYSAIRNFALRHGDAVDVNRDLLALGVANLASGLVHGLPVGAGYSATSANEAAGARSRLSTWVCAAVALLIVLTLLPLIADTPEPVLAAIVVFAVSHSLDPGVFRPCFRLHRDRIVVVAAVVAVLLLGVLDGLLAAIGVSLMMTLKRLSDPALSELGRLAGGHDFVALKLHPEAEALPGILILRPETPLFFANAGHVVTGIRRTLEGHAGLHALIVSLEESPDLDSTSVEALEELAAATRRAGVGLYFTRLKPAALTVLRRAALPGLPPDALSDLSVDDAVTLALSAPLVR